MATTDVTERVSNTWDPIWIKLNEYFERQLEDFGWTDLKGKMLYTWDGNHRLRAWNAEIDRAHKDDPNYQCCVGASMVDVTKENEGEGKNLRSLKTKEKELQSHLEVEDEEDNEEWRPLNSDGETASEFKADEDDDADINDNPPPTTTCSVTKALQPTQESNSQNNTNKKMPRVPLPLKGPPLATKPDALSVGENLLSQRPLSNWKPPRALSKGTSSQRGDIPQLPATIPQASQPHESQPQESGAQALGSQPQDLGNHLPPLGIGVSSNLEVINPQVPSAILELGYGKHLVMRMVSNDDSVPNFTLGIGCKIFGGANGH
ncbi:hypothetical protein L7F22_016108 [Adiantum nelumboides]|nr:hypothetical protein [Adiantum nelumboides]